MSRKRADLKRELRDLPVRQQLERVNAAFNRHPYVPSFTWGGPATGDAVRISPQTQCWTMDAKFLMLRALWRSNGISGWSSSGIRLGSNMRCRCLRRWRGLLLKITDSRVVPVSQVHHYRPYY
jgi:hypothetical protein